MKNRLIRLFFAAIVFAIPMTAWASECRVKTYVGTIEKTEALIKQSVSLLEIIGNPYDTLWGVESACTLLGFTISEAGKAESIRVIKSEPSRVLVRAAIHALRRYRFCIPEDIENRQGILLFQLTLEDLESDKRLESQN